MTRLASTSRAAMWVAAGVIGATVVTGVAFAGSNSLTANQTPSPHPSAPGNAPGSPNGHNNPKLQSPGQGQRVGPQVGPGGRRGFPGRGHGLGQLRRTLHGEFVVAGKDGKPMTVKVQRGVVTDVSATSITVKSSDGFSASYVINVETRIRIRMHDKTQKNTTPGQKPKATAADISVNDNLWVVAVMDGTNANAKMILAGNPKDQPKGAPNGDGTATPPAIFESSTFGI